MREYQSVQERKLMQVVCNKCGRSLKVEGGCLKEGGVSITVPFGYFSRRDGITHHFDLCEDCYDSIIKEFAVSVEEEEAVEML